MKNYYRFLLLAILIISLIIYKTTKRSDDFEFQYACGVAPTLLNDIQVDSMNNQLVFDTPYKWDKSTLNVYFMDMYNEEVQNKTLIIANIWSKHSNIKFEKTSVMYKSDIRVSFFESKGYASTIGNQAESSKYASKTTLSLRNLHKRDDVEFKRVVLHEFGHAIGMHHELQSPNSDILWDSAKVYKYYFKIYDWDEKTVNKNVFKKIITDDYTKFDPKSIMIYAVPDSLTKNNIAIPWPRNLSKLDKETINIFYPF